MLKKNWKMKIMAMLLIFTMTFGDFALVSKVYAASILDGFNQEDRGDTGSINVEFDASFMLGEENSKKATLDVNGEDLNLALTVNVKESGYLKNAKILVGKDDDANFEVNLENFENEYVQNFEDDVVTLNQVDAGNKVKIEVPVYYENESYVDVDDLSKSNVIRFEGTYVNNEAEEIPVSKNVELKLSWNDKRDSNISSEITKYITFNSEEGTGVILQTLVNVDRTTELNSLPIKNSKVDITVPMINEVKPATINVVAKSTEGINGKADDEVSFGEDNWKYDEETNILTIKVENDLQLVSLQNEDEVLKQENAPEAELYYSETGIDKYLITYTYSDVEIDNLNLQSNIKAKVVMFDGDNTEVENEAEVNYVLEEQVGNIVTYSVENLTENVSKAYTYLNYNNEENKYEIELDSKLIFNISYKDIVQGMYFTDMTRNYIRDNGEAVEQDDVYYKRLVVTGENFNTILGEDGFIKITDENGNLHTILNKEFAKDDNGNYVVIFENSVKNINIETSAPIAEGNLIVSVTRAVSNTTFNKDDYKTFDYLEINTKGNAKYSYVENLVECGVQNTRIVLDDTRTNADLAVSKENLSTLAMNDNVELRIEFNNDEEISDTYGNSVFEIKMPSYVETVEVTDASLVHGDGLELTKVEAYENDGRIYIRSEVNGKQSALSSGIVSNGTNIVLNTNIKVGLYTPAIEDKFELVYANADVTAYEESTDGLGYDETIIEYSAPSGLVSVNSISGYNNVSSSVTSVKQGAKKGALAVYSDAKIATMELTVMNNEANAVSNVAILGRIPFAGVKDIVTAEDLGTTMDTKMVSLIEADAKNNALFTIYYSENGEATRDLSDSTNGWTTEVSDLTKIKSYLIVPNDNNYQMNKSDIVRFTYKFEVPGNLSHNEEFLGTFATYYTNTTDVAILDEVSVADFVSLSTGAGPELEMNTTLSTTEVNEFGELTIETTIKNMGKESAENLIVEIPVPDYSTYKSIIGDDEKVAYDLSESIIKFRVEELKVTEEIKVGILVKFDKVVVDNDDPINIEVYTTTTCDELGTILESEKTQVTINQAELEVELKTDLLDEITSKGMEIRYDTMIRNLTEKQLTGVKATMKVDERFNFVEAYMVGFEADGLTKKKLPIATFNEETRMLTWDIGTIEPSRLEQISLVVTVRELDGELTLETVKNQAIVTSNETGEYKSGVLKTSIGKPSLVVTQTTKTTNTYVKEGETINYNFIVKNEGAALAETIQLKDQIPDGLVVKSISYVSNGIVVNKKVAQKDEVIIGASIEPGKTLDVNITALATGLKGVQELSVTNYAEVIDNDGKVIESNSITHIIEATEFTANTTEKGETSTGQASSVADTNEDLRKTYKLSGIAWLDKNENGMRDEAETLMKGVKATLVNSETGYIKQSVVTNSNGEYTFTGVTNGNYIIIFDYDTVLYTVTTYQKENITSNVNSDVITTKIEQDGVLRNGAVTGKIVVADGSISNIDIGLVEAMKFDLSLTKEITKMTVSNSQGTKTTEFSGNTLAKVETTAKYVAGSEVYVEYTFTVRNEGEIAGYAKKIVDYIPEDMNFNSGLNPIWYTGSDGNLYTTTLADVEIKPGEAKQFKLVLSRTMTDENTGLVVNTAEIVEDYNIYGVSDTDSVLGNKAQNEDDFGRANALISIKTGEAFIYISLIITTILLVGIAVFIIVLKVKEKVKRGGV